MLLKPAKLLRQLLKPRNEWDIARPSFGDYRRVPSHCCRSISQVLTRKKEYFSSISLLEMAGDEPFTGSVNY
jgi:hypothetical protein